MNCLLTMTYKIFGIKLKITLFLNNAEQINIRFVALTSITSTKSPFCEEKIKNSGVITLIKLNPHEDM